MNLPFKLWVFAVALIGCNSTGGRLITVPFEVGGVDRVASGPLSFSSGGTGRTWDIELDQAVIAAGPFYFNVQPPETGTLQSGVVIFERTSQSIVNALDPALQAMGSGAGETGHAVSVEVDLFPPDPTQSSTTLQVQELSFPRSAVAYIAGTAKLQAPDGGNALEVVPFQGQISIDLSKANGANPPPALQRVGGAQCELDFTDEPSTLEARIDPTHWFDGADFSVLIPPPPECADGGVSADGGCGPVWTPDAGALTWTPSSPFNSNVVTGIKSQTGVYLFQLVPGTSP